MPAKRIANNGLILIFATVFDLATLMCDNGADIRFIQAMLGHSKLPTTEIYTQVSIKKLQEIHTATHPARLNDAQPKQRKGKPKAAKPIPAPEGTTEANSVQ